MPAILDIFDNNKKLNSPGQPTQHTQLIQLTSKRT